MILIYDYFHALDCANNSNSRKKFTFATEMADEYIQTKVI